MNKLSCKSCGAPLSYDDGRWACEYCGTPYQTPEQAVDELMAKGVTVEQWKELMTDAEFLAPHMTGHRWGMYHGERVYLELETQEREEVAQRLKSGYKISFEV